MDLLINIVMVLAGLATALMAGLFYAWSCSVMPGLRRLTDREFIAAMQSANRAIQNPVFFAAFFGALILLPLSAVLHLGRPPGLRFWLLVAGAIFYAVGVFGVTVIGNVPLNERLDRFDHKTAAGPEIAAQRAGFERRWNNLNTFRTISASISMILVLIACMATN
jgi:uncharacterized membrane protein